jgi:hypothetical protein
MKRRKARKNMNQSRLRINLAFFAIALGSLIGLHACGGVGSDTDNIGTSDIEVCQKHEEPCATPTPTPNCKERCALIAAAVVEECLDGLDPGAEEAICKELGDEALAECIADKCEEPTPTPTPTPRPTPTPTPMPTPTPTPIGCDDGRCLLDTTYARMCKEAIAACIKFDPLNEEECILFGNLIFCDEGEPGPEPGPEPDPAEVCNEGLCVENEEARDDCEEALALCLANTVEANWEECVIGVQLLFCEVI